AEFLGYPPSDALSRELERLKQEAFYDLRSRARADLSLAWLPPDPNLSGKRARPCGRDSRSLSMNAVLGDLPTWNLADLYSSPAGSDLESDLKRAAQEAEGFAKDYEGKIAGLDGKTLGAAVARFEALSDLMGRIGSYAQLYYAQDQADPK